MKIKEYGHICPATDNTVLSKHLATKIKRTSSTSFVEAYRNYPTFVF